MSNPHRGEVSLDLGGRRYVLRLTLQALAEIEAAFAVRGLDALGARLGDGKLGAVDLLRLLGALVRGGGERMADSDLAGLIEARDLPVVIAGIAAVFEASFGGEGDAMPDPCGPQDA